LHPSKDFVDLGASCKITDVSVQSANRLLRGSPPKYDCNEVYTYGFTVPGSTEQVWSRRETVGTGRSERGCPEAGHAGSFKVGEVVACWKATALPVAEEYECPDASSNPECAKLFDPREELEKTVELSLAFSGVLSMVSGCVCGAKALMDWRSHSEGVGGPVGPGVVPGQQLQQYQYRLA